MKNLTKSEIQKKILDLNSPDKPYVFTIEDDKIVGQWNILDAKWFNILSVSLNKSKINYSITFSLDEISKRYNFNETYKTSSSGLSLLGFGMGGSFFTGKMVQRTYVWVPGVGFRKKQDGTQSVGGISYSFNTSTIKKPVIGILDNAGWKPKGFLTKFFSN